MIDCYEVGVLLMFDGGGRWRFRFWISFAAAAARK